MKKFIVSIVFVSISCALFSQVREFDKLELNYSQAHYKLVYRRANRLMDNPDFDFSQLPLFYKSLSLFQLVMDESWSYRKGITLDAAKSLYLDFLTKPESRKIRIAHAYEIASLKQDIQGHLEELKRLNKSAEFEAYRKVLIELFEKTTSIEPSDSKGSSFLLSGADGTTRGAILKTAGQFLGVPYVWAGESPTGFDCSGFTSYVLKQNGQSIPRTAAGQYDASRKLKEKQVEKGDLVFFSNGSKISHVGIIVSEKGDPLIMIHASSSKGIVITELEKSTYWMSRIAGFGTFLN